MSSFGPGIALLFFLASIAISAAEAALVSQRPRAGRVSSAPGTPSAAVSPLEQVLAGPRSLMLTVLAVNATVNALLAATVYGLVVRALAPPLALLVSVLGLTLAVAVFAEIFPRAFAARYAPAVAAWSARPVGLLAHLARPLVWAADAMVAAVNRAPAASPAAGVTEEELRTYLSQSRLDGILGAGEEELIDSVFELGGTPVRDVMVPRTDVDALPETASLAETLAFARAHQRSRIPVFRGSLDDIVGVAHAKDLLPYVAGAADPLAFSLGGMLREPRFVPEVMKCHDLLRDLRQHGQPLAVVVDEYGGMAGIVTLEDLLEEIVGEINDEYDEPEVRVRARKGGGFVLNAALRLDEADEVLKTSLPRGEYDTLGGLVFHLVGHLPAPGDEVVAAGWRLRVARMEGKRLRSLEAWPAGSGGRAA